MAVSSQLCGAVVLALTRGAFMEVLNVVSAYSYRNGIAMLLANDFKGALRD